MTVKPLFKIIDESDSNIRIDRYLRQYFPHVPFTRIQKVLRTGDVRVDKKKVAGSYRLSLHQEVRIPPSILLCKDTSQRKSRIILDNKQAQELKDQILFMDNDLIVFNKPHGLAVQGGSKTSMHLDGMLPYLQFDKPAPPKLVHRLDRDTSGILLLARSSQSARIIRELFVTKAIQKTYIALVDGCPQPLQGKIGNRLGKVKDNWGELVGLDDEGKWAETEYQVIDRLSDKLSLLALFPITGRTHQLRVHCQQLDSPIIGDTKYKHFDNEKTASIKTERLMLHAYKITFPHNGKELTFTAPIPPYMQKIFREYGLSHEK